MSTTYDRLRAQWRFEHDSYWGGERYRYPSQTTLSSAITRSAVLDDSGAVVRYDERSHWSYLVPHPSEADSSYESRVRLATYVNVVQPIVDAYAEATTSRVERELDLLTPYLSDVDRQGCTWDEHVEDVARWAAVYGAVAVVADTPRYEGALTRADEQALGVRPYVCTIHPPAWAWVDVDDTGAVTEFAYVDDAYVDDTQYAAARTVRLRVLRRDRWEVCEASVSPHEGLSASRHATKVLESGPMPAALGGKLPVAFAYYKRDSSSRYPLGQSLVADAADIGRAIYNALSWISEIHRFAGFPFLSIPLARTGGQLDALTRVQIGPQRALPFDATAGSPSYVQPSSESPRELREHCVWLFQAALRSAGLEMAADASSQVQSGEALRVRSRDFEARAARYARNLQRYEQQMLGILGRLAGVPARPQVRYPQRFTLPDPSADLTNAIRVLTEIPVEIGVDAKVAAVSTALRSALGLSDKDVARIADEVRRYFEGDRDAHLAAVAKRVAPT